MKAALALVAVSLVLLGISMSFEPFILSADGSYPFLSVSQGDSEAYHAARAQALTPKYRLQDYGGTVLALGLVVAFLSWRPLKAPASRLGFLATAIAAPILTAIGFIVGADPILTTCAD